MLTPEFCAAKVYNFQIGEVTCAGLEPMLKGVFPNLTRVASEAAIAEPQVVLLPRVIDVRQTAPSLSGFEVFVTFAWTVKDSSGRIVWLGSARGSAKHSRSSSFVIKRDTLLTLQESAKDAAARSASKMAAAPELQRLAQLAALKAVSDNTNRYTLEYVHSSREWKHNLRTGSYDQISEYLSADLAAQMQRKGLRRETSHDGICCKLTVELLTVKNINPIPFVSAKQDPGVDVTASVKLEDGSGNVIYTKEYAAGARVAAYTIEKVDTVMRRAIAGLAGNISTDEPFDNALTLALNGEAQAPNPPPESTPAPAPDAARHDPNPPGTEAEPKTEEAPKDPAGPTAVQRLPYKLITDSAVAVPGTGVTLLLKHMRFAAISGDVYVISGTPTSSEPIRLFTNDRASADAYVARFSSALNACDGSRAKVEGFDVSCFQAKNTLINRSKGKTQRLGVIESNGRRFEIVAVDFHVGGACDAKGVCYGVDIEVRDAPF